TITTLTSDALTFGTSLVIDTHTFDSFSADDTLDSAAFTTAFNNLLNSTSTLDLTTLAAGTLNLSGGSITNYFGTACTGNDFLQDIADNGAFSCATATGSGSGSNWLFGTDQTFIAPSTTVGVIVSASSTITTLTSDALTVGTSLVIDSQTFDSFTDDATLDNNSGDLRVVDVTCTDCLNATEIEDIFLLNAGDTATGLMILPDLRAATLNSTSSLIDTLTLLNDLGVTEGGTGASTLTGVVFGTGTAALTGTTTLAVNNGGTGAADFTLGAWLLGGGTSPITATTTLDSAAFTTAFNNLLNSTSTLDLTTLQTGTLNLSGGSITNYFGTACTGNDFLQDIADNGAFSCAAATGSNWLFGTDQTFIAPSTTVGVIVSASSTFDSTLRVNNTLTLNQASASTNGLIINASASPTANLLELRDSSGLFLSGFTGAGGLLMNIASSTALNIQDGSGNPIFTVDTTQASANSGIDITAGGAQTGNLLSLYSVADSFLSGFTASGGLLMNIASSTALELQNGSGSSLFRVGTGLGLSGVRATSTADTVLRLSNGSGTNDIFNLYDNATQVFRVGDGGFLSASSTVVSGNFLTASSSLITSGDMIKLVINSSNFTGNVFNVLDDGGTAIFQMPDGATATTTLNTGLNVDAGTFAINANENRVGIGTDSPSTTLGVLGDTRLNGAVTITGGLTLNAITGSAQCLNVDTNGLVSGTGTACTAAGSSGAWQTFNGTNVLTPTSTGAAILVNAASSTITNLVVADSLVGAGFTSAFDDRLNATTTLDLTTLQIGTDSAITDITGTGLVITAGALSVADNYLLNTGDTGAGLYVFSDLRSATLNATTTNVDILNALSAVASSTITHSLVIDATTLVVNANENRVGIGTDSPSTTLGVLGDTRLNGAVTITGGLTLNALTAGSLFFAGTGGLLSQDNANIFWDNTDKRLLVGPRTGFNANAQSYVDASKHSLAILKTSTDVFTDGIGATVQDSTTDLGTGLYGHFEDVHESGTRILANGIYGDITVNTAAGAITTDAAGVISQAFHVGAGTTANLAGFISYPNSRTTGTVDNNYGVWIGDQGGVGTNNYGLKISDQAVGATNWAIKTGTGKVEFGDVVGIASSTPWGLLSVEMGTTNPSFVVSNTGSSTPAFYIGGVNQNGFVGIGTASPGAQLELGGTGQAVTNNYGLLVDDKTAGTNNWNIYSGPTYTTFNASSQTFAKLVKNTFAALNTDGTVTSTVLGAVNQSNVNSGNHYAAYFQSEGTNTTGTMPAVKGFASEAVYSGAGGITTLEGGIIGAYTYGSAGDVGSMIGSEHYIAHQSASTVSNAYVSYIDPGTNTGGGTIDNLYGLYVDDQTAGTNNWAIKTGLGKVEFGDQIMASSSAITSGNFFTASTSALTTGDMMKLVYNASSFTGNVFNVLADDNSTLIFRMPSSATATTTLNTGLNIDGGTFAINANDNFVGIGTASPSTTLGVIGTTRLNGATTITGGLTLNAILGSAQCLQVDSNGLISGFGAGCTAAGSPGAWETLFTNAITPTTTTAGIFVRASSTFDSTLRVNGAFSATSPTASSTLTHSLVVDSSTLVVNANENRVGIGTASPLQKLHVKGAGEFENGGVATDGDQIIFTTSAAPANYEHVIKTSHAAGSNSLNWMKFSISDGADALVDTLTLTGDGYVGIASTTPWGLLSVEMDTTNPSFVV
ncbi:MAG: hypothetical protein Q8Q08_06805, partial [Candidatus Omnitrophota bacterium]|nr:hypothetical protein [Candidatus Omnitrophota bacterium]